MKNNHFFASSNFLLLIKALETGYINQLKSLLGVKELIELIVIEYKAFSNMEHGFCAARGDWTNKETKKTAMLQRSL